jgi:hypothetical protein
MDFTQLLVTGFFSLIGCAYFVYGKKQAEGYFLAAGALLMAYPYFVSGALFSAALGLVLAAAPFAANRMGL